MHVAVRGIEIEPRPFPHDPAFLHISVFLVEEIPLAVDLLPASRHVASLIEIEGTYALGPAQIREAVRRPGAVLVSVPPAYTVMHPAFSARCLIRNILAYHFIPLSERDPAVLCVDVDVGFLSPERDPFLFDPAPAVLSPSGSTRAVLLNAGAESHDTAPALERFRIVLRPRAHVVSDICSGDLAAEVIHHTLLVVRAVSGEDQFCLRRIQAQAAIVDKRPAVPLIFLCEVRRLFPEDLPGDVSEFDSATFVDPQHSRSVGLHGADPLVGIVHVFLYRSSVCAAVAAVLERERIIHVHEFDMEPTVLFDLQEAVVVVPVRVREDCDVDVLHTIGREPRAQAVCRLSALESIHEHDLSCADHCNAVAHAVIGLALWECDMWKISIKCHNLPPYKKRGPQASSFLSSLISPSAIFLSLCVIHVGIGTPARSRFSITETVSIITM